MIIRSEFYTLVSLGKETTLHAESGVVLPMDIEAAESYVRANYYGLNTFLPETDTPRLSTGQAIPYP